MRYNESKLFKSCIDQAKIIVVEGFDFTGKSYFMNELSNQYGIRLYEPSYDSDLNSNIIPYSDRYVIGMGLIDLVEKGLIRDKLIVNRGLASGLVYNELYHQGIDNMDNYEFISYTKSKYSDPNLIHTIYIQHFNIANAKELYKKSIQRSSNEEYDRFDSFEDYWKTYEEFHKCYQSILNKTHMLDSCTILNSYSLEIMYNSEG